MILVIGGTKGLGKIFAWQTDCDVVGRDICDITDFDATRLYLQTVVAEKGKLSGLVFFQRFRGTGDSWSGELKLLSGMHNLIEYVVEHRFYKPGFSIVMVSSVADSYVATEQPLSYHIAKAGMAAMMRFYAVKLAPIRVNCVSPAAVLKDKIQTHDFNRLDEAIPMGVMGAQQGMVETINFLLNTSYLTGQNIVVDGGLTLRSHESLVRS